MVYFSSMYHEYVLFIVCICFLHIPDHLRSTRNVKTWKATLEVVSMVPSSFLVQRFDISEKEFKTLYDIIKINKNKGRVWLLSYIYLVKTYCSCSDILVLRESTSGKVCHCRESHAARGICVSKGSWRIRRRIVFPEEWSTCLYMHF